MVGWMTSAALDPVFSGLEDTPPLGSPPLGDLPSSAALPSDPVSTTSGVREGQTAVHILATPTECLMSPFHPSIPAALLLLS